MTPFQWLPVHVAAIAARPHSVAPKFTREQASVMLPEHDVWDRWPVLRDDGTLAEIAGGLLVIALTAAKAPDPEDRHHNARLRLFHFVADTWRDLGPVLPLSLSPGTREWAGSATLAGDDASVTLYFTAAGRKGEAALSFTQRLFESEARLLMAADGPTLSNFQTPVESVPADGALYETDMTGGGAIGTIKAFRDPYFFRTEDGDACLLFTASDPTIASEWNGVIGIAQRNGRNWELRPPLVRADDVNNELERPHIIEAHGSTYLFWSTQEKVFRADGPKGPTGLYGVVADRWGEPWRPLNQTGLVFANPGDAPFQAYSFQVLPDLSVWSFADMPGVHDMPVGAAQRRAAFAGGAAPVLHLRLNGDEANLIVS